MEAIILILIIVILVLLFKRTFSSIIYATVIVDLFLHLVDYINSVFIKTSVLDKLPSGILDIINSNSKGLFNTIFIYVLVLVYIIFEFYIIKYFIKKR